MNETQVVGIVIAILGVLWVWLMVSLERERRQQRRFLEDLLRYLKKHGWEVPNREMSWLRIMEPRSKEEDQQ
jgi:hypothetical protein